MSFPTLSIPLTRTRLVRFLTLAAIVAAISTIEPRVVLEKTHSVKYRALLILGGEPHKGDYVNLQIQHPLIERNRRVTITKRIGCVAGEKLSFHDDRFYCNQELLGGVLKKTWRGEPLTAFAWSGPVPQGKVFLIGDHPRSFDSRYFGFVNTTELTKLWPLF